MTPAEELTAAADKLEALIGLTKPGPWHVWTDRRTGLRHVEAYDNTIVAEVLEAEVERDAEYINAMCPYVGRALVALLRTKAQYAPPRDQRALLDLARAILAKEQT